MGSYVFVFSSPLQFMFCCLVSKDLGVECCNGFYYNFGGSFRETYKRIADKLNQPYWRIKKYEPGEFDTFVKKSDIIYLGNRYGSTEMSIYSKYGKTNQMRLYEEGFNTYLPHHFNNSSRSDSNNVLQIKNLVKRILGRLPSHIYLSEFDKVHTVFRVNNVNGSKWMRLKCQNLFGHKALYDRNKENNSDCIILSQSLSEDGFAKTDIFIEYLEFLILDLLGKYETVYFKEHPRGKSTPYSRFKGLGVLEIPESFRGLPVELFLTTKQVDVYGFFSSTLMYASSLMNKNCYEVFTDFSQKYPSKRLKDIEASNLELFGKHNIRSHKVQSCSKENNI